MVLRPFQRREMVCFNRRKPEQKENLLAQVAASPQKRREEASLAGKDLEMEGDLADVLGIC